MNRTPAPSPEILDIAAVVTGEQQITLTGWQLDQAIAAMTALGHSTRHIAYCTNRREDGLRRRAAALGIALNGHDKRPDWVAIDMVVNGGITMHLLNVDRVEAVRAMAAKGIDSVEMGRRLDCAPENIRKIAHQVGAHISRDAAGWDRIRRNKPARRRQAVAA